MRRSSSLELWTNSTQSNFISELKWIDRTNKVWVKVKDLNWMNFNNLFLVDLVKARDLI